MTKSVRLVAALIVVLCAVGVTTLVSGQGETIVTIATPEWMNDIFRDEFFEPFEAEHPGVKVVVVSTGDEAYYGSAAYDLEDHLEKAGQYSSRADVLYTATWNMSVESTRAGYFLDLTPLIQSDTTLDTDDFFPAVWQSFQWDNGHWGMPVSASVQMLVYNKEAFDNAGLPYPDENWTLTDLVNAARELTTYKENGDVDVPGLEAFGSPGILMYSLLGHSFYDDANQPAFDDPELPNLYQTWFELQEELLVNGGYDYDKVPLSISEPWRLTGGNPADADKWGASLLPGGRAGISVQGFAISRGTENPEVAFELAKYLTGSVEVVARFFGTSPARRSLVGQKPEDNFFFAPEVPEEVQVLLDEAMENAIPYSEMRFADYLNIAYQKMSEDKLDAEAALQAAEEEAINNLQTAESRRETETVMVSTPVPTPVLAADQIALQFGLQTFTSSTENRDQWDQLIKDFTAENPAIGNIDLVTQFFQPEDIAKLDCYFQPYNIVPDANLTELLPLDPFMDADPDFDRDDFLKGVLAQVQRDNQTWGYPIIIQPSVMWYNGELFDKAGLLAPEGDWSVESFSEALRSLSDNSETGDPPFSPQTFGNTYLLMLMAAYGSLPYDYRTTPPTVNFSDAATLEGMRQVLDLAREKLIDYKELGNINGSFFSGGSEVPIFTETLSTGSWRLQNRVSNEAEADGFVDPNKLTNYPAGNQYTPVAYSVGSAHIGSQSQNPEACYSWIKTIASRPDLLAAMPARRSLVETSDVGVLFGEDLAALYQTFVEKLDRPDVIVFPGEFGGSSGSFGLFIEQTWMNRAFDNYILKEGNLEQDLADAASMITTYRECYGQIPAFDPSLYSNPEEAVQYYRQYVDCAVDLDPSLKEQYSFYYQDEQS